MSRLPQRVVMVEFCCWAPRHARFFLFFFLLSSFFYLWEVCAVVFEAAWYVGKRKASIESSCLPGSWVISHVFIKHLCKTHTPPFLFCKPSPPLKLGDGMHRECGAGRPVSREPAFFTFVHGFTGWTHNISRNCHSTFATKYYLVNLTFPPPPPPPRALAQLAPLQIYFTEPPVEAHTRCRGSGVHATFRRHPDEAHGLVCAVESVG